MHFSSNMDWCPEFAEVCVEKMIDRDSVRLYIEIHVQ